MKCMRCGKSDRISRVRGLSLQFQEEDMLVNSVSVTAFHWALPIPNAYHGFQRCTRRSASPCERLI
jgi:hypothetical protein